MNPEGSVTRPRQRGKSEKPPRLPLTAAARTLRARLAAHALHSKYDSRSLTAKARQAFNQRFDDQVDPDRRLSDEERARRAAHARKAFYTRLSYTRWRGRRANERQEVARAS